MTFICAIPKIYETESSTELFKNMYSMMMNRVNYSKTSYTVTSFYFSRDVAYLFQFRVHGERITG